MPNWVAPVASYMASGFVITIELVVIAIIGSTIIGVIMGALYTLPVKSLRVLLRIYIEFWRALPLIVSLFFIFFALPVVGVEINPFTSAAIGFLLWGSAQVAEVTRGAMQSISDGQREASAALGLNWVNTQIYVIFPQAFRRLLPPLVSLLVNIAQNTTLASVLGVIGLLEAGNQSIARLTLLQGTSHAPEILGAVLVVFFVVCFPLSRLATWLEKRN